MSRVHTGVVTTIDRWLLPHMAGVLGYATLHKPFAETIRECVLQEDWDHGTLISCTPNQYLLPHSTAHADEIADWVLHELATHPEARIARGLLARWADSDEPHNLVLGIVGLAVIGPTLGLIENKKKKRSRLQILISDEYAGRHNAVQLAQKTHKASQQLIATELRRAAGKVTSLHPDTAEWCMGTADTQVTVTDPATLIHVLSEARVQSFPYHCSSSNGRTPELVAISPSVRDEFVNDAVS
jgi:hypothetical protein